MNLATVARPVTRPVLRLDAVSRRYDGSPALAPVSLALGPGTAARVTGHNGSGKSTLLRVAAGLLQPSEGARVARGRSLYLLSGQGARGSQSAAAAVTTAAVLAGVGRREAALRAADALDLVGLGAQSARPAGSLSSGQRARLTLAVALACPADLVCLDEPTAHLDESGGPLAGEVIGRLRSRGAAVLVATHDAGAGGWPADAHLHLVHGRVTALPLAAVPRKVYVR